MNTKTKKILIASLASLVLLITAGGILFEAIYLNKIYPGVHINGLKVGGKSGEEAERIIRDEYQKFDTLTLEWGPNRWVIAADKLGLHLDASSTVQKALLVGRTGKMRSDLKVKMNALTRTYSIDPYYTLDENKLSEAVSSISAQLDVPAREPEISFLPGTKEVTVTAGEDGEQVDDRLLKQRITLAIKYLSSSPVDIPVVQLRPKLSQEQVEITKKRAESVIGKKLVLQLSSDNRKWELEDQQVITWLDPQSNGWNKMKVEEWVSELAGTVNREAQNASFRFENGRVQEFNHGKQGLRLLQGETADRIIRMLLQLEQGTSASPVELAMETTEPVIKTSDVNDLGIKELLARGESWFSGSITNRIFNLKKSAEAINGVLVAPGETFSFNTEVGEISSNTGYRQAYIIKDGKTILGDGGGVCQTSSTLFRAVLNAGLPIEERAAHAYRVSYYEENYQPGFDATIFQPAPDFKFKNDTPGHILIQMVFDEKQKYLAFEIYGTSDGRKAEVSKARVWDVVAPPPDLYQDDPTLATGTIRQLEHKAWGAKVAFDWKVTRGDEVLQQRTFYSNYRPWQAVYLRGTRP